MLKFMLASRSKPEHTKERYYFEWGIIHVALMLSTPTVMSTFRRYAQHYVPDGLDGRAACCSRSPKMSWENMADHWLETWDDLVLPFKSDDYPNRMQPHNFGDSNFDLQLMTGEELFADGGYYSGGVKLVQFLHRRDGRGPRGLQGEVPRPRRPARGCWPRTRCASTCRTPRPPVTPRTSRARCSSSAASTRTPVSRRLWFDDVDAVYAFCGDAGRRAGLLESYAGFVDDADVLHGHDRARRVRLRHGRPHQPAAGRAGRRARSRRSSTARATPAGAMPGWEKRTAEPSAT